MNDNPSPKLVEKLNKRMETVFYTSITLVVIGGILSGLTGIIKVVGVIMLAPGLIGLLFSAVFLYQGNSDK